MSADIFHRRLRGFRIANLVFGVLLLVSVAGVYLAKTMGGDEKNQITRAERAIASERAQIRLLKAEVSYLSRPERLEKLAVEHLALGPIDAKRRISDADLPRLAPKPVALPAAPVLATPTVVAQ